MKTVQTIITATLIATTFSFSACSGGSESKSHEHNEAEVTAYHCPMECEGDKTYTEEGTCPVCGMDLVVKSE